MAAVHWEMPTSPRTTELYGDEITLDEVERIKICGRRSLCLAARGGQLHQMREKQTRDRTWARRQVLREPLALPRLSGDRRECR
jgi:hypothetical protein